MGVFRNQPILRQVIGMAVVLLVLLATASAWSAYRTRAERAVEVQTEAGTIATTAVALFNQYLSSLDAMALSLERHPAVVSLDGPAASRLFVSLLKDQPLLGNILLRDDRTKLVASAVPAPNPEAQAPSLVKEVLVTGVPKASQLVFGPITQRRTLFLAYPVRAESGRIVGVLGFSVLLPKIETLFSRLPLPPGSVVVLADQANLIMARSVDSEKYIGSSIDIPSGSTFQRDADGVERFHGVAMIDRGPWMLSVAIPRTEVLRRLAPLWERNLIIIGLTLVTIVTFALWIAWQMALDLKRLQVSAHKIAEGDFSPPEERAAPNLETAQLQSSFVTMAERLRVARDTVDRQLAQERKMLEAVQSLQRQVVRQERLAAVGVLVSGIAHELNNPLQAILGTIEVVERQPDIPNDLGQDIALIKTQSNRARDIIRNLSRFSSQKPGAPTDVDLRDVVASVVQLRKRELDSASIALDVEFESVRPVFATFEELEQVVLNFVVNAQQAIQGVQKKNGRIMIRLVDAAKRVRLEVWDDGPGVDQADERKLFQPFFTTKPVGQGTGLGLSVTYGIIDAYGGQTGYFNNEWGGATFYFELPIADGRDGPSISNDRTSVLRGRVPSGV